ncbi:MAG TPA: septation protein A [Burkholderiaceae bacterium]|nr:septation protein A [Burkholderiaceae bacterium]
MKILLDLLPVVVFFTVFRIARASPHAAQAWATAILGSMPAAGEAVSDIVPVILATACAIVATVIQVGWLLIRRAKVSVSVWLSLVLIMVFGGLTVWLHNEWFIKWKPTLLYWAFAAVLAGGQWIWKRNLLGVLFSRELQLPQVTWDRLLVAWAAFFLVLGGLNLFVAYQFSTAAWVDFKTFGLLGLTLAYSVSTAVYVARHLKESSNG